VSGAVTNPDPLSLYLAICTSLDVIHEIATSLEGDVGRAQIYCEPDAIERALQRMKSLATTMELLNRQLHSCVRPTFSESTVAEEMNGPTRAAG
jgi:hypothetical protein